MTKKSLIDVVAKTTGYTKKDVTVVVDSVFDKITETLVNGEEVAIAGFGKFGITERGSRSVRNPQTGELMTLAATKTPKFKASATLKSVIKGE